MQRLMIAGFGEIARRALPRLEELFEVLRIARRYGFDLDRPESLAFEGAHALFHCAPPPGAGESDTRTANLLAALEKGRTLPARVVYVCTSHIHADDLAAAAVRALTDDAPAGVYNVADDTEMKMGDWFDLVAEHAGLPRPARVPRAQMRDLLPEDLYSFMCESRRLDNRRMKQVLGVRLRYPTVYEGLRHEHALGVD